MDQDFERDLLFLLHDVARLVRVEADRRARVHGTTRAQWGLLIRLAKHPGLTQKEVADLLEVEPISVARLVDRMQAAGLLERRADAQDRRVWRLHLLPQATEMLAEIDVQRRELAALVASGIPPERRHEMIEGLRCMKRNLLDVPGLSDTPLKENA